MLKHLPINDINIFRSCLHLIIHCREQDFFFTFANNFLVPRKRIIRQKQELYRCQWWAEVWTIFDHFCCVIVFDRFAVDFLLPLLHTISPALPRTTDTQWRHKWIKEILNYWSRMWQTYMLQPRRVEKGVSDRNPMITKITKTARPKNKRFWPPKKFKKNSKKNYKRDIMQLFSADAAIYFQKI